MPEKDQSKNTVNRRHSRRVEAGQLPEGLREFNLDFGSGQKYTGTTIDASLKGISFLIEVPSYKITNPIVKLTSSDNKISMTQELVYIKALDPKRSRISLLFDDGSTPVLYRKIIQKALNG